MKERACSRRPCSFVRLLIGASKNNLKREDWGWYQNLLSSKFVWAESDIIPRLTLIQADTMHEKKFIKRNWKASYLNLAYLLCKFYSLSSSFSLERFLYTDLGWYDAHESALLHYGH